MEVQKRSSSFSTREGVTLSLFLLILVISIVRSVFIVNHSRPFPSYATSPPLPTPDSTTNMSITYRLGWLPEKIPDESRVRPMRIALGLPTYVDWTQSSGYNWMTSVKNQLSCGSCVAFGTIGAFEAMIRIQANDPSWSMDISEQHLFSCGGGSCSSGWYISAALNYLRDNGSPDEACFPYQAKDSTTLPCSNTCSDWQSRAFKVRSWNWIGTSPSDIQTALLNGPLVGAFYVYTDFFYYTGGIYRYTWGVLEGGHCIAIVGYDSVQQYWICKNSWGSGWGENGYFRIAFGQCEIEQSVASLEAAVNTLTYYTDPSSVGSISADGVTKTNGATGAYRSGARVRVIANPPSGYVFVNWEASGVSVDNQLSQDTYMTVSSNGWLKAHFVNIFQITITSSPTGSGFVTVDGLAITTPQTFMWAQGSTHALAANSPVSGGTGVQYVWLSWSDGGAQSHTISVPAAATTYTANFKKQYMLTVSVSPAEGGTLSVTTGWRDEGTEVAVTATPSSGYSFYYWSLDGANVGSSPSYSVLMNAPHSLTALFRGSSSLSLGLSPGSIVLGASVTLSGTLTPTQPTPGIPAGTVVILSYSLNGSAWTSFITTKTGSGGVYSVAWYPPYVGSYQIKATWSGDQNYGGAASSVASLTVTGAFPPRIALLITGPASTARGSSVAFDVLVTNPGSPLSTTLHFEVTGPGGYRYFDSQQITVGAGEKGRFQFIWQVPSAISAGQYEILVCLIPPKPTAIAQTQIIVT